MTAPEHPPVVHKDSEHLFHIDPTGRMRVPVRIFSSERLLPQLQSDQSLIQACNAAALPGIVDASIVLPDAHQGYGLCIGGVVAFDSIISPGSVGMDINCLPPSAKVSMHHGTWMRIGDMERSWRTERLRFLDRGNVLKSANPCRFLKRRENDFLYSITTDTGHVLEATGDHPVLTTNGMKPAKDLTPSDTLVLHPFKGVEYEDPGNGIIAEEADVVRVLDGLQLTGKGNGRAQILAHLRDLDILPLRYDSPKLPVLAKILGFVLGDGHVSFNSGGLHVGFCGKSEDLRCIRDDLSSIGVSSTNVHERMRQGTINTFYGPVTVKGREASIAVNSTGFGALLIAIGCPYGSKPHQEYRVPSWLMRASLWQKRLFLAAFFGAELSSPKTLNGYNFYEPQLNMKKAERFLQNGIAFLDDIRTLLFEFGIESSAPVEVPGYAYDGKNGPTRGVRLKILGNPENLLKLYERVGFEYNRERFRKACLAINYLCFKRSVLENRNDVRMEARQLRARNVPVRLIVSALDGTHTSEAYVQHSIWGSREDARVPRGFLSFKEYCEERAVGQWGFARAAIQDTSVIPYSGWVYDVTMDDDNHNFIADNFVVSNCGVRLLSTNLAKEDVAQRIEELLDALYAACPVGVGGAGVRITPKELDAVLVEGARWAVAHGRGDEDDLLRCEANGCLPEADASAVPTRAKQRGKDHLGTVGAGNHFVEVQAVERVYDRETAQAFGLREGQVVVMIHCGSRGLGHQTCVEFLKMIEDAHHDIASSLPDRELMYVPLSAELATRYWGAMNAAANFAFANRHILGDNVRRVLKGIFGPGTEVRTVYDVCHNIAKRERHRTMDGEREVLVHRKGATRAFPPHHPDIPDAYRDVGQPVLIPGSMGTASYVLVGAPASMELSFGSTAHGAGRTMSRMRAKRDYPADLVAAQLSRAGVSIKAASRNGISEEAPGAYKDVDEVIRVSDAVGIAKTVARLVPIGVIKG